MACCVMSSLSAPPQLLGLIDAATVIAFRSEVLSTGVAFLLQALLPIECVHYHVLQYRINASVTFLHAAAHLFHIPLPVANVYEHNCL